MVGKHIGSPYTALNIIQNAMVAVSWRNVAGWT